MNDPKQNYYLKKDDLIGQQKLQVAMPDMDVIVHVQNGQVVRVEYVDDHKYFDDVDAINAELGAGATLGQAITSDMGQMNENDFVKKKLTAQHAILRNLRDLIDKKQIKTVEDVNVWIHNVIGKNPISNPLNENKTMKKQNEFRELIKECIQEVVLEEYQQKQAVNENMISEMEASPKYWIFVKSDGSSEIQNIDDPRPPENATEFTVVTSGWIDNKPAIGKYLKKVALTGGALPDQLISSMRREVKPRMWRDIKELPRLTKKAGLDQM